jgi:hypothetical protein
MATASKAHDPITPGEILLTEFLEPMGITQYRLAQATGLSQTRISEIVRGKRAITTDTAPGCPRPSGSTTASGSTSRPTTTSRSSETCTPTNWPR